MSNVMFFDGTDDYVDCGNNASLNITDNVTQEIWFKHNLNRRYAVPGVYAALINKGAPWVAGGGGYGMYYHIGADCVYVYYRDSTNTSYDQVFTAQNLFPDIWWHVVSSFSGGTMRVYVNGNLTSTVVAGFALLNTNGNNLAIGNAITIFYQGLISEVRIYNRTLSDTDVLYNYGHPGNPQKRGLVMNLTQETLYGTTWLDTTGVNNGTYAGGALPRRANLVTQR